MALIHDDKPAQAPHDGPHPAICLATGFGVIIAAAMIVHVVFNMIM